VGPLYTHVVVVGDRPIAADIGHAYIVGPSKVAEAIDQRNGHIPLDNVEDKRASFSCFGPDRRGRCSVK